MKKVFSIFCLGMIAIYVSAAPVFYAGFDNIDDYTAKLADGTVLQPRVRNQKKLVHQTLNGFHSLRGRGVLFAADNLKDFSESMPKALEGPLFPLVYRGIKDFPVTQGTISVSLAPFWNSVKPEKGSIHNYVFRFFQEGGKACLSMFFLRNEILVVQFEFTNGQHSYLYYKFKNWPAGQVRKIHIVWSPGNQKIFDGGKLVKEARVEGTLDPIDSVELGGHHVKHSMQGILDELTVQTVQPPELVSDRDGDPAKYPVIAPSGSFLEPGNWKIPEGITVQAKEKTLQIASTQCRPRSCFVESKSAFPVDPGEYIKVDLNYRKTSWSFGSAAVPFMVFSDKNGKILSRRKMDQRQFPGAQAMLMVEFNTLTAKNAETIDYSNYLKAPARSTGFRLDWEFHGNPAGIEMQNLSVRKVDPSMRPWYSQPIPGPQLVHRHRGTSEAELDARLKKMNPYQPKLITRGDRVILTVDGKELTPGIFHNTGRGTSARYNSFRKAGFEVHTVHCYMGKTYFREKVDYIWKDDGT
ncbi:MAG: hypothetical protein J5858_07700, partial [Lentisphaeria bacterium]|nr:hypothetical protein [Lentisphaeria bacterium]